jgi:2-polyprenyl-3-methyl-5-hydroxy-6-metoxy-1,4-benzoquinol methylase
MSDVMRVSDFFDRAYQENDRYWWRDQDRYAVDPDDFPQSLLTQQTLRVLQGRPGGQALDIGAGEGSDAIRLARLGYQVDAVEMSAVGAGKIKDFASRENVEVNVITADIQDFVPDRLYDVIVCNGVLHYVEDKDSVIALMQKATKRDGINVVSLWSTYTPVPECHEIVPVYCDDEDGVVTSHYKAWVKEFIYFERGKAETAHNDLPGHQHSHIKLIARKPLG